MSAGLGGFYSDPHKVSQSEDSFLSAIKWSMLGHLAVLVVFSIFNWLFSPRFEAPPSSLRVDLVGLPDLIKTPTAEEVPAVDPGANPLPNPTPPEPPSASSSETKSPELQPPALAPTQETAAKSQELAQKEILLSDRTKEKKPKEDSKNAKSAKDKTKLDQALKKLKLQEALAQLEKQEKAARAGVLLKGAEVSRGSDLKGVRKLEHAEYSQSVERKVKSTWFIPQWMKDKKFETRVRIFISSSGEILRPQVIKSSGQNNFDRLALESIERASPLPAPTESLRNILEREGILLYFGESE